MDWLAGLFSDDPPPTEFEKLVSRICDEDNRGLPVNLCLEAVNQLNTGKVAPSNCVFVLQKKLLHRVPRVANLCLGFIEYILSMCTAKVWGNLCQPDVMNAIMGLCLDALAPLQKRAKNVVNLACINGIRSYVQLRQTLVNKGARMPPLPPSAMTNEADDGKEKMPFNQFYREKTSNEMYAVLRGALALRGFIDEYTVSESKTVEAKWSGLFAALVESRVRLTRVIAEVEEENLLNLALVCLDELTVVTAWYRNVIEMHTPDYPRPIDQVDVSTINEEELATEDIEDRKQPLHVPIPGEPEPVVEDGFTALANREDEEDAVVNGDDLEDALLAYAANEIAQPEEQAEPIIPSDKFTSVQLVPTEVVLEADPAPIAAPPQQEVQVDNDVDLDDLFNLVEA